MATNYQKQLEDLRDGKISELEVSPDEFMDFQKILMSFAQRKSIVGIAKRGGGAKYVAAQKEKED